MNKWYQNALLVNHDGSWDTVAAIGSTREEMERNLHQHFRKFAGYGITDMLMCLFTQAALYPSKHIKWLGDNYLMRDSMQNDPLYKQIVNHWICFREFRLDPIQIFIDEMNAAGIRPWLTLRMNDVHRLPSLRGELFEDAKQQGYLIGEEYGYYAECISYRFPRMRETMLLVMKELLENYDFFGLELDFQREIYCFDYKNDPDCHLVMTEFMRQAKSLVQKAEKKAGHPIRLMIRTSRSPQDALEFGFDVRTYCEEGLVDAINPTPRWELSDSAIPVRQWRELAGDEIAVFPGVEVLNLQYTRQTTEQTKAYAAAWFAQGGDGIYTYNMFEHNDFNRDIWNLSEERCLQGSRCLTVTRQDIASGSYPVYRPLPMELPASITLDAGVIHSSDRLTIVADYEGTDAPTLSVGTQDRLPAQSCPPVIRKQLAFFGGDVNLTAHQPLSWSFSGIETDCSITLTFAGSGVIHYLDLNIDV